jgi:hypothetical protein
MREKVQSLFLKELGKQPNLGRRPVSRRSISFRGWNYDPTLPLHDLKINAAHISLRNQDVTRVPRRGILMFDMSAVPTVAGWESHIAAYSMRVDRSPNLDISF